MSLLNDWGAGKEGGYDFDVRVLWEYCEDIVREQKSKQFQDSKAQSNILSSMIKKAQFSDEELTDQMLTFLAAG